MVVLYDAAIRADGDVDARLGEVLVTCLGDLDDSRSLTTTDTLLLTG